MTNKSMSAWIIKLEWMGDHIVVEEPIVDILSAQENDEYVRDHVQRLHDLLFLTLRERVADSQFHQARIETTIKGTLIHVGHNPYLEARKYSNIRIECDDTSGKETITADGLLRTNAMNISGKIYCINK